MRKDTSGPAFPQPVAATMQDDIISICEKDNAQSGMTLLDWFSAVLSDSGLADITITQATALMGEKPPQWGVGEDLTRMKWWCDAEARYRYLRADAMMKERAR